MTLEPIFVQYIPKIIEENKIYISMEYGASVHLCACGCKEKVHLPFDDGTNWWTLTISKDKTKVSFKPSIGRWQSACKSHYYITNNEVIWA
jgi:CDGSH-type Zn-finger protein